MTSRARAIRFRGEVTQHHEALIGLEAAGDAVLIRRGPVRALVLACPDGCGDVLTVNLDKRAGNAWRLYGDGNDLSLYPSVWRDGGCKSHFIIRRGRIWWFGPYGRTEPQYPTGTTDLRQSILGLLPTDRYVHFLDLADEIEGIPWEVEDALERLVKDDLAECGTDGERNAFRRKAPEFETRSRRRLPFASAIGWLRRAFR